MINRILKNTIKDKILSDSKIIIIYGPRQVGKTTIAKEIISELPQKSLQINADQLKYIDVFSSRDLSKMKQLVEGYELLFIDEAQRIPEIGINLKILHDEIPTLKIIVTGSSSLEIANKTKEALTGRTWTFNLYPIAVSELLSLYNSFEINEQIPQLLIYGSYPNLFNITNQNDKIQYLTELCSAYLYKDILELSSIRHADKLRKLLQLLAFQVGSEVSLNEIANTIQISKETVAHYIDLLEKSFVLFRLSGFSRNLKKEISKSDKIYFYDLGIRNTLINNFNPIELRNDTGQLWENFLVIERLKRNKYSQNFVNSYFWRTYTGAELDYIEESNGQLNGFEMKFGNQKAKVPKGWIEHYPESSFQLINQSNFIEFIKIQSNS
jgi:uncharacterized protein